MTHLSSNEVNVTKDEISQQQLISSLRFALYRFGDHYSTCARDPCTCGFSEAWKAAGLPATFGDAMRISQLRPLVPEIAHD